MSKASSAAAPFPKIDGGSLALAAASAAVLAMALLPCVVVFSPQIYFDVDPRFGLDPTTGRAMPITAIGPAGAAWVQAIGVLVAAAAITVSLAVGGRVRWWSVGLVGAGMAVCGYHMTTSYANAIQGGAWLSAAALGLAAAHLAQHATARRWMTAGFVAILAPIALQAVWYITMDYPATVAMFEANEADLLAARGWAEGSSQHELYKRRLLSPDAIGTFGLSNVLGSIAAGLTLLSVGVTIGVAALRSTRRWAIVPGAVAALGLIGVWLTNSKGAVLTLPAGAALIVLCAWVIRRRRGGGALPVIALLLVALAASAVVVRGWIGPPSTAVGPAGERSLLFRYHYWQGAGGVWTSEGAAGLALGVGPADFKAAYLVAKNPINPEEVTSSHNVFVDFAAMLGVGGIAWAAVLIGWLWAAGRWVGRSDEPDEDAAGPALPIPLRRLLVIGLVAAVFGTQYAHVWPQLVIESALWWMLGVLVFVGVMLTLLRPGLVARRWRAASWFTAAAAVLMHNQIEMSFFHGPSAVVVWTLVGAASASPATAPQRRAVGYAAPAALLIVALVMMARYAPVVTQHEQHLAMAAAELQRDVPRVYRAYDELSAAAMLYPTDTTVLRWRVVMQSEVIAAAQRLGRADTAIAAAGAADAAIDQALDAGIDPAFAYRLRAGLYELLAGPDDDSAALRRAAEDMQRVTDLTPYSLQGTVRLARLRHRLGDEPAAARAAQRAMELNDFYYLDPARQLDEKTLAEMRSLAPPG